MKREDLITRLKIREPALIYSATRICEFGNSQASDWIGKQGTGDARVSWSRGIDWQREGPGESVTEPLTTPLLEGKKEVGRAICSRLIINEETRDTKDRTRLGQCI